jgi:nucleoside-diphosphate-sugar epimerase
MTPEFARAADHFGGRTVLVTGAFGFIGGHVVRKLSEAGATLRLLARKPRDRRLGAREALIQGDLLDPSVWDRALDGVDTVYHLAAQTSARTSELDPLGDYRTNAEATWRLVEACRRRRPPVGVVFAGTHTECGVPRSLPLTGTEPDRPCTFYDLHKLFAEQSIEHAARRGDLLGTTLRLGSVYGPGTREGSPDCGVLNGMIRTALEGKALSVYGAGDRLRDYTHVEDVARAFVLAGCELERLSGAHFVVGAGERRTIAEAVGLVADTASRLTGHPVKVMHVAPPADELEIAKASFSVDASAFRKALGWEPRFGLVNGIEHTARAFLTARQPGESTKGTDEST